MGEWYMRSNIIVGDANDVMKKMKPNSVHTIVTSPPYWSLRNYGVDGQLGMERSPEEYTERLVSIMKECKRILRDDGTLWLNLGSTYAANRKQQVPGNIRGEVGNDLSMTVPNGLKPKDMIPIPWFVGIALQQDGWWLRQDIIWAKACSGIYSGGTTMPDPSRDKCTSSHEYVLLLSKSRRYFYDNHAVRERSNGEEHTSHNRRSVWTINLKPYKGSHFATFPPALPETCVLAGTSEKGACPECGSPWNRVVEIGNVDGNRKRRCGADSNGRYNGHATKDYANGLAEDPSDVKKRILEHMRIQRTIGWKPSCKCHNVEIIEDFPKVPKDGDMNSWTEDVVKWKEKWNQLNKIYSTLETVPCVVLDPFNGAGTTGVVATNLGRDYIGIEINPEYAKMSRNRIEKESEKTSTKLKEFF
jgi:site-specific DNA-methyltransferase (adenine-specific)